MAADFHILMVTGGARSGKSLLAETMAAQIPGPRHYIATAQPWDAEMTQRIARHRLQRGEGWTTHEEPVDLIGVLARTDRQTGGQGVRLVDCMTLWLSNLMAGDGPDATSPAADPAPHGDPMPHIDALCHALAQQISPVILVTNELGLGIVPENALARRFRDVHGLMNQRLAAVADHVWMAVSGLPLCLKPQRETP